MSSEDSVPTQRLGPAPTNGARIGGCVLEKPLGQGGMGTVWAAKQLSLDRPVAVKLLSAVLSSDAMFIERFKREAKVAGRLNAHNVVHIHDAGTEGGLGYIVMERLEGWSLQDRLDKQGPLKEEEALDLLAQSARGIDAAHRAGLVHRDVKPGNLFLCNDGTVKVLDFGLAHDRSSALLTQPGDRLGTPHYMSPEHCEGKPADERSDIYSLGATVYAAVQGKPPFNADTPIAILRKHVDEAPKPLTSVRPQVNELILAMMAKDPKMRPSSMEEVIRAADALLGRSGPGSRNLLARRAPLPWKKIGIAAAGVLVLAAAVFAVAKLRTPPQVKGDEREKSRRFATFRARVVPDGPKRATLEITMSPKPGVSFCGIDGHRHKPGEFGIDLSATPGIRLETREILNPGIKEETTFRVPFTAEKSGSINVNFRYQAVQVDSEELDSFDKGDLELDVPVVLD